MKPILPLLLAISLLVHTGCRIERIDDRDDPDTLRIATTGGYERFSDAELERDRYSGRFRSVTGVDTAAAHAAARANQERLENIQPATFDTARVTLPLGGDVAGPSVLRAQILLDRAGFAPGQIDGRWGDNTEKAVFWFQQADSLPATGVIDSTTYQRLEARAGRPSQLLVAYTVTAEDAAAAYAPVPEDIYAKAEMDSLGYASFAEKLGEQFHASPELLRRLNPNASFDAPQEGDTLQVPNVAGARPIAGSVARLVVSGAGKYLHAVDAAGRILYHFPTSIGASYDPSPQGDFRVTTVTRNPWWHYQPSLLADVPDDEPEARIPPGPNNAVGRVWIALNEPHYGLHGTSAPQSIGYESSAGCVRLTNWDALFLADLVAGGTPVVFRDVPGRSADELRDSTQVDTTGQTPESQRVEV